MKNSAKYIDKIKRLRDSKLVINVLESIELTCFTCDKSRSNEECNRKAIDETCQQKQINNNLLDAAAVTTQATATAVSFNYSCMTVHRFDSSSKKTISIEKKCSADCRPDMIGCINEQPIQTCTYCCNKNYCNMESAVTKEETYKLARNILEANSSTRLPLNQLIVAINVLFLLLILN